MSLTKTLSTVSFCFLAMSAMLSMQSCKVFRSTTKDVSADAAPGFMRPLSPEEIYSKSALNTERLPLNEVSYVLQLDPYEVEAKGARMLLAPNGENVEVFEFDVPIANHIGNAV